MKLHIYITREETRTANDHGKKPESKIASSYSGIIHCFKSPVCI